MVLIMFFRLDHSRRIRALQSRYEGKVSKEQVRIDYYGVLSGQNISAVFSRGADSSYVSDVFDTVDCSLESFVKSLPGVLRGLAGDTAELIRR